MRNDTPRSTANSYDVDVVVCAVWKTVTHRSISCQVGKRIPVVWCRLVISGSKAPLRRNAARMRRDLVFANRSRCKGSPR